MSFIGQHIGEIAALSAASFWVITSLSFAAAGRRIGPTAVNLIRMCIAFIVLIFVQRIIVGPWVPQVDSTGWVLLAASGLIGLSIGDQFLFTALVDVGPRLTTLLMTLTPPITVILAWPILHEPLSGLALLGMAITLAGIVWVVLERPAGASARPHRHHRRGICFGALAAACQAGGLILTKLAIGHTRLPRDVHLNPWTATLGRMVFGVLGIIILAWILKSAGRTKRIGETLAASPETEHLPPRPGRFADAKPAAILLVMTGAIFGPVLGVWCSIVAVDRTEAGIAATLMAMTPVFILPFAVLIERERISWRATIGAIIAVAGVAVLASV